MEIGRDDFRKALGYFERIALANEKLIELATEERIEEAVAWDPGYCPHCGVANPRVRNEGGTGEINDFVLAAHCENCGETLYGIPKGWMIAKTKTEARNFMEGRNGTT